MSLTRDTPVTLSFSSLLDWLHSRVQPFFLAQTHSGISAARTVTTAHMPEAARFKGAAVNKGKARLHRVKIPQQILVDASAISAYVSVNSSAGPTGRKKFNEIRAFGPLFIFQDMY